MHSCIASPDGRVVPLNDVNDTHNSERHRKNRINSKRDQSGASIAVDRYSLTPSRETDVHGVAIAEGPHIALIVTRSA